MGEAPHLQGFPASPLPLPLLSLLCSVQLRVTFRAESSRSTWLQRLAQPQRSCLAQPWASGWPSGRPCPNRALSFLRGEPGTSHLTADLAGFLCCSASSQPWTPSSLSWRSAWNWEALNSRGPMRGRLAVVGIGQGQLFPATLSPTSPSPSGGKPNSEPTYLHPCVPAQLPAPLPLNPSQVPKPSRASHSSAPRLEARRMRRVPRWKRR